MILRDSLDTLHVMHVASFEVSNTFINLLLRAIAVCTIKKIVIEGVQKAQSLCSRVVHEHAQELVLLDFKMLKGLDKILSKGVVVQPANNCLEEDNTLYQFWNVNDRRTKALLASRCSFVSYICNNRLL